MEGKEKNSRMIKVAIYEDSRLDREMLRKIVIFLMEDRGLEFQVDTFENGESLVDGYNNYPYNLIFLDIMMGEIDGMEVGRQIREMDSAVEIVYCTSSKDFAIAAYEIHALGYLLKPYESGKIGAIIDYYVQKHPQKDLNYIEVKSQRKSVIIPYKDIIYMESDNKVVYIHTTKQGTVKVYNKLDFFEEQIKDERYLRCHQSYLVNLNYVAGMVDSDFIMLNDDVIPIRKSGRKLLIKKYQDFLKKSLEQENENSRNRL